ncbi:hypothetical protein GQ53DRAFT_808820 [Thozetella sp. PMI_491]|nr:hypothetical protein GQ53DRAFT_808820 [Thozetella sp. PMI_491]
MEPSFLYRSASQFHGVVLIVGLLVAATTASNCSVSPLVLPITNVTFPDGVAVNRGIRLVLGGQVQGLRMSTILNNTRVRNVLDCPSNSTGLTTCEGTSGSVYKTVGSSFQQVPNLKDWNVSVVDPRPSGATTVVQGYDNATFVGVNSSAIVPDFPFEVWANHDALNKSALALGPKSSVLERLVDHDLAPSSQFSIDYGSRSELYPRDGQLIVGGNNEARYDNKVRAVYPMWGYAAPINCPLQVLLEDVILTNSEGDHSLFDDPDSTITACIDTIQNAFTWTPAMFATWQNLTRWVSNDSDGTYTQQTYPADREHLIGTLTIKLAGGYSTVIPHYELISQERGTDEQGKYAVVNNSRVMAGVQTGLSDLGNNVPILGGIFLALNYLHVDYANRTFWLSPQVGNDSFPDRITTSCEPSSTTGGGDASSSGGNSNLGLQVGLPVAFVVIALGLVAYYMYRRNKHNHQTRAAQSASNGRTDNAVDMEHGTVAIERRTTELMADYTGDRRISEIQGNQLPIHKDDVIVAVDPRSPLSEPEKLPTYELDASSEAPGRDKGQ